MMVLLCKLNTGGYARGYAKYISQRKAFEAAFEKLEIAVDFGKLEENKDNVPEDAELAAKYQGEYYSHHDVEFLCNDRQFIELQLAGYDVKVKSKYEADTVNKDFGYMQDLAQKIIDKLEVLDAGIPAMDWNHKCDIHMPGMALMTINQTMLMEDSCTDALQDAIDQGWRIIAACPQPDKRRPDYILGRYNPEHSPTSGGAARKP
ncbi:hypothetical protein CPT_MTx_089 [Serratia phage MTx]|uniref:Uncharacterized protein n=1 Tax=Serratia phage MTx TaxID=2557553 RepID=A0A482MG54_9CAUD|nr:hypothetical protein HWC15_gp089 [Serratia phage MTx]QBQ72395.1 hypothetical protein CPT_MTx_089 [Serratia phage MTx]